MTIEQSREAKDIKSGSAGAAMKVTDRTLSNGILGARTDATGKTGPLGTLKDGVSGTGTDRVDLSVSQERIDRLTSTIASMEGASSERIESLKKQISEGTYKVSGQAVAEKMLRSLGVLAGGEES
ncbi:MAG: flagellar biosynthesis anti-sigma factor FlgM [Geobacteraceae bacterium]|nr:flagellar biosynthesis anti-sigma factor FlgM [Geobacteraceae bacterium]